ncbi:hypothetical protein I4U23_023527 [Adineta vaga]|nr:hypothetical protein I4U23_023527 [Adineta vaga]
MSNKEEIGADFMVYSEFFAYYGTLLLPFVCAGSMPELKIKLKNMFCLCWKRQERLIHPHTLPLSRRAIDRQ